MTVHHDDRLIILFEHFAKIFTSTNRY